jgi:hypothetical protein
MFLGHLDYFQKPPLGGRLHTKPQNHKTMALRNLTTVDLLYLSHVRTSHE